MAVVKTQTMYVLGREFKMQIRVLKDGLFRIKLPSWVSADLTFGEVSHETQRGVEKKFEDTIKQVALSRQQVRKVIMIDYRAAARIWERWEPPAPTRDEHEEDEYEDYDPWHEDDNELLLGSHNIPHEHSLSFNSGGGLTVYAQVFEEKHIVLEDGLNQYKYTHIPSSIPPTLGLGHGCEGPSKHQVLRGRPQGVIEWTPEAEAFFAALGHNLDRLIMGIHDFMSQDTPLIESQIKQGNLLTFTPKGS